MRRILVLIGLLAALASAAHAQLDTLLVPSDTLVVPPDTVVVPPDTVVVPPDTVLVEPDLDQLRETIDDRAVLLPPGPPRGAGITPVPARAPRFTTAAVLDARRGTWRYDLGVPGAPEGLVLGLAPPHRIGLRLDGVPADDLFTGRPAIERLPSDLLGPLFEAPGIYGSPAGLDASFRAFAADVPITELRYRAGPDDHQFIGVSHAQVRRPAFIERIGGTRARLGFLLHVSGDRASGEYTNAGLRGFQLIGRLTAALPGLAVELTERHLRRTEGAWGGVEPGVPDPFVRGVPVRDPFAERQTIHNDLSLRARTAMLPLEEPLLVQLYWTAATHRYSGAQVVEARGHRYGLALAQVLVAGDHRILAEADLRLGRVEGGNAFPGADTALPPEIHVHVRDSVRLADFILVLEAGAHASRDFAFPAGRVEVGHSAELWFARLSAHAGGARFSPVERLGFGDALDVLPIETERVLELRTQAGLSVGPLDLVATGEVSRRLRPRLLVLDDTLGGQFVTLDGELTRAAGTLEVGFRQAARRGVYAQGWVSAQRLLEADSSPLQRRVAAALPEVYAYGRLGFRALGLFDDALDIDLFSRGRAWTDHRGRTLHPSTALLGLAPPGAPIVPASGTLDFVAEAVLGGGRATVFLAYQNALAGLAYRGVYLVPVYPLAEPRLRVGIFWVLAG